MDQITYSYSSASSSSSSINHPPKTIKSSPPSYTESLHSVRKPTQKPITKQFIAPLPPTPQKVYKVKSSKFKEVVRMLTSTPEFQSPSIRRLKDIAPPPLTLSTIPKPSIFPKPRLPPSPPGGGTASPLSAFILSPNFSKFLNETLDTNRFISKSPVTDYFGSLSPLGLTLSPAPPSFDPFGVAVMSPLGLNMSPSSLSWCSSLLPSPIAETNSASVWSRDMPISGSYADKCKGRNGSDGLQLHYVPPVITPDGKRRVILSVDDLKLSASVYALHLYGYLLGSSMDYKVVNVNLRRL
ncbi:hypothetical protein L1987_46972 [Smallanthus sonchifolius]|uniref:Uncharacterized protein n=1 Tax=Smallanthus sonchifolius TaxID=185202 RepID=A0ACB9G2B9_9ASTR|nr:hypothetical protein L1987_46972 [Smallanthus sonchifolius]